MDHTTTRPSYPQPCARITRGYAAALVILAVLLVAGLLAPALLGHALSSGYFLVITIGAAMVAVLAGSARSRK